MALLPDWVSTSSYDTLGWMLLTWLANATGLEPLMIVTEICEPTLSILYAGHWKMSSCVFRGVDMLDFIYFTLFYSILLYYISHFIYIDINNERLRCIYFHMSVCMPVMI